MAKKPGKFDFIPKKNDPSNRKGKGFLPFGKPSRAIAFWVFLFLLFVVGVKIMEEVGPLKRQEITYTHFNTIMLDPDIVVSRATIIMGDRSAEFHGIIDKNSPRKPTSRINNRDKEFGQFMTKLPRNVIDNGLLEKWQAQGLSVEFREPGVNLMSMISYMFPWILFIFIWFFLMRQMQGGAGGQRGIFSFGKSKAKAMMQDRPKVTFNDVAGCDEAKEDLQEVIDFLRDPKRFKRLGGKIPKGALLLGPPGTGKTLLARAVAGEAKVPFFSMSGSDFVEMFVGVGASRVRDLFDQSKKNAPCIVFIDEIDAVGRHRGAGLGGGHDEREQTLNQLLVEMDGFESNEGVILVAATNRPDVLDPALLRPGRFDRQIVVDRPDIKGRKGILEVHSKNIPLDEDVNLATLARGTPGLSGADLANLVNEAALMAARDNKKKVTMSCFEEAKDKVMMGTERRSRVITDHEKKIIAYHEAGHALVGKLVPLADPVHKITIIPRGRALGLTFSLPTDDRYINSKEYILSQVAIMLGGRQAEWLIFKERSTGCANDIERATELARRMVCDWGMSDKLGPVTFGKKDEEIFLGRSIQQHRDYSEATAQAIDQEVREIVEVQIEHVNKILEENKDKLVALSEAVLEYEILTGDDLDRIMRGETPEFAKKQREEAAKLAAEKEAAERDRAQAKARAEEEAAKRQNGTSGQDGPDADNPEGQTINLKA